MRTTLRSRAAACWRAMSGRIAVLTSRRTSLLTAAPTAFLIAAPAALLITEPAAAQSADDWTFGAGIYVWLPSIDGTTTFPPSDGGSSAGIDMDTIVENLKMAFMASFDAHRGQVGLFTDLAYVDIGDTKSGTHQLSLGGVPLPADVSAKVGFDLKGWAWTLTGLYQAVKTPGATVDLIGGVRLLDLEDSLDWTLSGNVGSVPIADRAGARDNDLQNWDAIAGVRGRLAFGPEHQWFVPYHLDVGTGESNLTWQAMVGFGYSFGWGDVLAAWRHLDYDMKSGATIESLSFDGPVIAAVFRW
jgi:hypothetical protein